MLTINKVLLTLSFILLVLVIPAFGALGTTPGLVMIGFSVFAIFYVIEEQHRAQKTRKNRMLAFTETACELKGLRMTEIRKLFSPLFNKVVDDSSLMQKDEKSAFLFGLGHLGTLHISDQLVIKADLQRIFDSCLHELAVNFFKADKAQTEFRKENEKLDKDFKAFESLKGTMSEFDIESLLRKRDTLQKEVDEAKKAFNTFRDAVKEFGYRTWPHYRVYVLLKVR